MGYMDRCRRAAMMLLDGKTVVAAGVNPVRLTRQVGRVIKDLEPRARVWAEPTEGGVRLHVRYFC